MTVAIEGTDRTQDFGRDELETELNTFALNVHNAIQDARSKMSDERRAEADTKAAAIFERANSGAKRSQRTA
jgi:hypothetical protein